MFGVIWERWCPIVFAVYLAITYVPCINNILCHRVNLFMEKPLEEETSSTPKVEPTP